MQSDLSELLERVDFCRQKSNELQINIARLAEASISSWMVPGAIPNSGEINAKLLAHPPTSIRQEVGMIVNEQRSILDALACKLATRNGANFLNDVYFPITKTKAGFYELGLRKIRKLSTADKDAIEAMKPWLPSNEEPEDGNHLIFQLHEADRVRKHQDLLRWSCWGGVFPIGNGYVGELNTKTVIFQEIGKEENLAYFRDVTTSLRAEFGILYSEPTALAGHGVAPLLSAFNDKVEEIVSNFA